MKTPPCDIHREGLLFVGIAGANHRSRCRWVPRNGKIGQYTATVSLLCKPMRYAVSNRASPMVFRLQTSQQARTVSGHCPPNRAGPMAFRLQTSQQTRIVSGYCPPAVNPLCGLPLLRRLRWSAERCTRRTGCHQCQTGIPDGSLFPQKWWRLPRCQCLQR